MRDRKEGELGGGRESQLDDVLIHLKGRATSFAEELNVGCKGYPGPSTVLPIPFPLTRPC